MRFPPPTLLAVLCCSQQQAGQVKAQLAEWLAPRGLAFNEDKTRIVHAEAGFDFLGFNVRRYHRKLLIKPSLAAIRRIRERLRTEFRALRGSNAGAVLRKINPIVRWVEQDAAPARIVATQTDAGGATVRTRPVFPYPEQARYAGTGSIDDAANFVGVMPAHMPNDNLDWVGQDLFH